MANYARTIDDVLDATIASVQRRAPHLIINQAYDHVFNTSIEFDDATKKPNGAAIRAKAIELAAACVRLVAEFIDEDPAWPPPPGQPN